MGLDPTRMKERGGAVAACTPIKIKELRKCAVVRSSKVSNIYRWSGISGLTKYQRTT